MKGLRNSGMSLEQYAECSIPGAYGKSTGKFDNRLMSRHQYCTVRLLNDLCERMLTWAKKVGPRIEDGSQMYNDFNSDLSYVQHSQELLCKRVVETFSNKDKLVCNKLWKKYYYKESFNEPYYRSYM